MYNETRGLVTTTVRVGESCLIFLSVEKKHPLQVVLIINFHLSLRMVSPH